LHPEQLWGKIHPRRIINMERQKNRNAVMVAIGAVWVVVEAVLVIINLHAGNYAVALFLLGSGIFLTLSTIRLFQITRRM
jgi:uncharacterized membrane protein